MNTFYLIRHGQKVSEAGDPGLTELGKEQARKTAKFLKDKKKFLLQKTYELSKIENSKSEWDNNIKLNESNKCKETDIIDIDIGGTHRITTSRCTLIKVCFNNINITVNMNINVYFIL